MTSGTSPCEECDTLYTLIKRSEGGKEAQEIARVQRAASIKEFSAIAGATTVTALKQYRKLKSDDEAWEYIRSHRSYSSYTSVDVQPELRRALGTAYLDQSAASLAAGTQLSYSLSYKLKDGSLINGAVLTVTVGAPPQLIAPRVASVTPSDSFMRVSFFAPRASSQQGYAARVYRSTDDSAFILLDGYINVRSINDTLLYSFLDNVQPEKMYRYYIVPQDAAANKGANSDTVRALSLNFRRMPLLQGLTASDMPGGIQLRWQALPAKPYWAGIEISRRALDDKEYMVLDTIAWQDTSYTDIRVGSNAPYAYALRALTYKNMDTPPSAYANAVHEGSNESPLPPIALEASAEQRGVRLHWRRSADEDIRAYYVYRAVSLREGFSVISPPLKDTTYFDNDSLLYGRTTYIYTVRAVRYNEKESANSNLVYQRPQRPVYPVAPQPPFAYDEFGSVRLSWRESTTDRSAIGYNVYRRVATAKPYPSQAPAASIAGAQGFAKLNSQVVSSLFFDDKAPERGRRYEYAISAVDALGMESGLSPSFTTGLTEPEPKAPSTLFAHPVEKGIELSWSSQHPEFVKEIIIYRRSSTEGEVKRLTSVPVSTQRYTDTTAQNGIVYRYSISILSTGGKESERSREKAIEKE